MRCMCVAFCVRIRHNTTSSSNRTIDKQMCAVCVCCAHCAYITVQDLRCLLVALPICLVCGAAQGTNIFTAVCYPVGVAYSLLPPCRSFAIVSIVINRRTHYLGRFHRSPVPPLYRSAYNTHSHMCANGVGVSKYTQIRILFELYACIFYAPSRAWKSLPIQFACAFCASSGCDTIAYAQYSRENTHTTLARLLGRASSMHLLAIVIERVIMDVWHCSHHQHHHHHRIMSNPGSTFFTSARARVLSLYLISLWLQYRTACNPNFFCGLEVGVLWTSCK